MGKKSDLIAKARSYYGVNYKHFCGSFWGGCYPWCASFVAVCGRESGNGDIIPWTTSCTSLVSWYKAHGGYRGKTVDIDVGDLILYEFYNPSDGADHIGIVVEVDGNMIKVIEGNKGDLPSDQTKVEYREIPKNWSCICEVCRPKYDDEEDTPAPTDERKFTMELRCLKLGDRGENVKAMQQLLEANGCPVGSCGCDGDIGRDTVAALKNYQRAHQLEADGVCGPLTWASLLK